MDGSLSQVLRWGVAGWCYILQLAATAAVVKLLLRTPEGGFSLFVGRLGEAPSPEVLLLAITSAGIPLGFLLYEVYYYLYWCVPLSRGEQPERPLVDRLASCGRLKTDFSGLDAVQDEWIGRLAESGDEVLRWRFALLKKVFRRDARELMRSRNSWSRARACWLHAIEECEYCGKTGKGSLAAARFEYLSSLFDGLGATRISLWVALATIGLYALWRSLVEPGAPVELLVVGAVPVGGFLLGLLFVAAVVTLGLDEVIRANRLMIRSSQLTMLTSFICSEACEEECMAESSRGGTIRPSAPRSGDADTDDD